MILSGDDERDVAEELCQESVNFIKYFQSDILLKFPLCHRPQLQEEITDTDSASSFSSADTEDNQQTNTENNMDYLDDPDTDYSESSDLEELDWRAPVVQDSVAYEESESSNSDMNDEEMSDSPQIMDGLSDYSEHEDNDDLDHDDLDNDDLDYDEDECDDEDEEAEYSPQDIDVDNDNSVETMPSEDEEPPAEYDDDLDEPDEETVNEHVVSYDIISMYDSSGSDSDHFPLTTFSTTSDSTRSPISETRQNGVEGRIVLPPLLELSSLDSTAAPIPNGIESIKLQPSNVSLKDPVDKPSSSKSPIDGTGNLDDEGLCCICLDSVSNHVVVPCGHICLCQHCKDVYESNDNHRRKKKCPLCKTPFTIIIKVYK